MDYIFRWAVKKEDINLLRNCMENPLRASGDHFLSMSTSHGRAKYTPLSPLEELNDLIMSLQNQLQHGNSNRAKEKQILQEIKKNEEAREAVIIANSERQQKQRYLGSRKDMEYNKKWIEGLGIEIERLKKRKMEDMAKIKSLRDKIEAAEKEINSLQRKLADAKKKRTEAYKRIVGLQKQIDDHMDVNFQEYLKVMDSAQNLVSKKNIVALKKLSKSQVENFMSQWNKSRDFRDDYEKKSSPFLESRQLCKDGRMRNPKD